MKTMNLGEYEKLPKAAKDAARRIAARTGETPLEVSLRTRENLRRLERYTIVRVAF